MPPNILETMAARTDVSEEERESSRISLETYHDLCRERKKWFEDRDRRVEKRRKKKLLSKRQSTPTEPTTERR
jgi:hypothetical protein